MPTSAAAGSLSASGCATLDAAAQPAVRGAWADADVVAVDADCSAANGPPCDVGPVFDALVPAVGERQHVVALRRRARNSAAAISATISTASVNGLMPAFSSQRSCGLTGPCVQRDSRPRGDHRVDAAHTRERIRLVQLGGEEDRKSHLIELDAGPERPAVRKAVLRSSSRRRSAWRSDRPASDRASSTCPTATSARPASTQSRAHTR